MKYVYIVANCNTYNYKQCYWIGITLGKAIKSWNDELMMSQVNIGCQICLHM
jgi:hypothetical protein